VAGKLPAGVGREKLKTITDSVIRPYGMDIPRGQSWKKRGDLRAKDERDMTKWNDLASIYT